MINIYVVYKLNFSSSSDITLDNCLFGAVTQTKNGASAADLSADLSDSSHAKKKKISLYCVKTLLD